MAISKTMTRHTNLPQHWNQPWISLLPCLSVSQLRHFIAQSLWRDLSELLIQRTGTSILPHIFADQVASNSQLPPLLILAHMFGANSHNARALAHLCIQQLAKNYDLPICECPVLSYLHTSLSPQVLLTWQSIPLAAQHHNHTDQPSFYLGSAEPYSFSLWNHFAFAPQERISTQLVPPHLLHDLLGTIHTLGSHAHKHEEQSFDLTHSSVLEQIDPTTNSPQEPNDESIVRLCHNLFAKAIAQGASDLHLEKQPNTLIVLARIDGMLQEMLQLNHRSGTFLINKIKLLAELDTTELRRPQDGRISVWHANQRQEIRVSVMPTIQGEKIVLRFFDPLLLSRSLQGLGMPSAVLNQWKQLLSRKAGLLLTVGPTGSGKTSTLYASLGHLAQQPLNICTVEDPVEIIEPRFNQIQVHNELAFDFATALKHLLRQDPDVIMVGEIRDSETAQTAMQAALTGHLVLASLHTTDALAAIPRLHELGLPSYLLGATLVASLAQRLVRTCCMACTPHTRSTCEVCNGSGYSGRKAIFELLPIDNTLIKHALQHNSSQISTTLSARRHTSLWQAGEALIAHNITTRDELMRVCPPPSVHTTNAL